MSDEIKYYMGIDEGGYDKNTFAICVVRSDGVVEYLNKSHDKDVYEKEVKRLAEYYNIPEESILKETNK